MVTKPAQDNVKAAFAKMADAYSVLAQIHSKPTAKPVPERKTNGKRDQNAPKQLTAYTLFVHEKRLEIASKELGILPTEAWSKVREAWKNISPDDHERYEKRVAEMKNSDAERLAEQSQSIPLLGDESETPVKQKAPQPKRSKDGVAEPEPASKTGKLTPDSDAPSEKRKKKSAEKEASNGHDEKKKKKKKSHKSKHTVASDA
ncbi:hypothetical protein GGI04_002819 [Coemansia thaxteri]|uniref:HMG box domain-containing protein n=1 Tax=Coemansia thaxteri TaxID=2663907 RepID=A0A9W8EDP6_9FUNG|nr:hypothetical protein H4R26_004768 [Coemansia thaxteri]KAJ2003865.1 hypothetical protein GGI04_002819 [Coemansia thaxteri]KAJ2467066.1 hypothetical protein GGI02_004163 [Coemansia sp. RSA 2322]KAJ2475577.1 hypothetical protein EV174_005224 [Coemansia sp. RSA 2320]